MKFQIIYFIGCTRIDEKVNVTNEIGQTTSAEDSHDEVEEDTEDCNKKYEQGMSLCCAVSRCSIEYSRPCYATNSLAKPFCVNHSIERLLEKRCFVLYIIYTS